MQSNEQVEKIHHYKDGEARKGGHWTSKAVMLRVEIYAVIEEWQKRTGMKRAQFWREAVMRGALEVAKSYGLAVEYPKVEPVPSGYIKPKRKFPSWLFRK